MISKAMHQKKFDYSTKQMNLLINLLSVMCFGIAIYLGTFAAGDEMAVAPVWMFFFAILIFNRMPLQNLMVVFISLIIFTICSYLTKSPRIFRYDMMHAITSVIASLSMSWEKSRMKMENIYAFERLKSANLEIMETVEEQERRAELLLQKANRDELTGFLKKNIFEQKVKEILNGHHATGQHALVCIDIDDFKMVNDQFGHLAGDKVLAYTTSVNREYAGAKSILGRFGGDEFCVFFSNVNSGFEVEESIENIMECMHKGYQGNEFSLQVCLSIGIALTQAHRESYEDLFQRADKALYRAKNEGKNRWCL